MTTIAASYAERVIVTDGSVSDQDQVWSVAKAERVGFGIYATAGDASDGEKFMNWIRRSRRTKRPTVDESFQALALTPEGLFFFDSKLYPMRLEQPHAIGSGAKAARAAMLMGASPQRAVEIACEIDAGSRMPVQVYHLEEEKK